LIATLSYNNPGAAVAAVEGLIQLGEPAVPALLEQLDLHNYTARAWAIRALAGIGDPRGLVTLLDAATADFAFSVRRAAARGLGIIKWHWFPSDLRALAQQEALTALLSVAQEDEEWVVRYAALVGIQAFAASVLHSEWRSQIQAQLQQMADNETNRTVQARVWMAQQFLQSETEHSHQIQIHTSPLSDFDWQPILEKLQARQTGFTSVSLAP
jgi:phycocyanobilin lyase beta subunit